MSPSDAGIEVHELDGLWEESVGDPRELFEGDDPQVQARSYVIRPGERVPEMGTTSHGGPELSVVLSGEVVLGLPDEDGDEEYAVGPDTFVTIPAGTEHYSENRTDDPVKLVYTVVGDL